MSTKLVLRNDLDRVDAGHRWPARPPRSFQRGSVELDRRDFRFDWSGRLLVARLAASIGCSRTGARSRRGSVSRSRARMSVEILTSVRLGMRSVLRAEAAGRGRPRATFEVWLT